MHFIRQARLFHVLLKNYDITVENALALLWVCWNFDGTIQYGYLYNVGYSMVNNMHEIRILL